jgi:hypothetical protein
VRFDDLASIIARNTAISRRAGGAAPAETLERGHSGRRFVIAAGVLLLVFVGVLYLTFLDWRQRYRARARYGANAVVPAINPLEKVVPPGLDPAVWRAAVSQTRAMLLTVTGSNLLTIREMNSLRAELDQVVAHANPETALRDLAGVWDAMGDRAEFLFRDSRSGDGQRHERPGILPSYGATQVVPVLKPLETIMPSDVDPVQWRDAVSQTREMLLEFAESKRLSIKMLSLLRAELELSVARAVAHPESAVAELGRIWSLQDDRASLSVKNRRSPGAKGRRRPAILSSNPAAAQPVASRR